MKKLLGILIFLGILSIPSFGQTVQTVQKDPPIDVGCPGAPVIQYNEATGNIFRCIRYVGWEQLNIGTTQKGTSLPVSCSVGDFYDKTDATPGSNLYSCTATNTWTVVGGGATIPAGSAGACQFYLTSTTFGGDSTRCYENITSLSAPPDPTVTNVGTPGAGTYGYKVVATNVIGQSLPSAEVQTTTSRDPPNNSNYNAVATTCGSDPAGTVLNVYLTTAGMSGTVGFLGTVVCGSTYNDKLGLGNTAVPPSADSTSGFYVPTLAATTIASPTLTMNFMSNGADGMGELVANFISPQAGMEMHMLSFNGNPGELYWDTAAGIYGSPQNLTDGSAIFQYNASAYHNGSYNTVAGYFFSLVSGAAGTGLFGIFTGGTGFWTFNPDGTEIWTAVAFSALPTVADGAIVYCSDCKVTTVSANVVSNATCTGSGGGSFAKRVGGAWKCEYTP